jgi:hypothetical protein
MNADISGKQAGYGRGIRLWIHRACAKAVGRAGAGRKRVLTLRSLIFLLASCTTHQAQPTSIPTPSIEPHGMLTAEQVTTLGSLELVDDHPLYTMRYVGSYSDPIGFDGTSHAVWMPGQPFRESCQLLWGCSLFATLGDEGDRLFGRNFDWQFSPALLVFTDPADGYASVSMVDMEYLGFEGDRSRKLMDLSLEERQPLLESPFLPFDGMNEKGLAVGMAAVPVQEMPHDPQKPTIYQLLVMREILDHARTVQEAIDIFGDYNIDMGKFPIHYLIASAMGDAALVEFYQGGMVVFRNESPWQSATNFLLASTNGNPEGKCRRYDRINQRLEESKGEISFPDAFRLLEDVSQDNTQWSAVYNMTNGELGIVMGRDYSRMRHTFHVEPPKE